MKPDEECDWVYSFVRFSSTPQEQGESLRRQTTLLDAWLKRHPHLRLNKSLKAWDGKAVTGFTAEHRTRPQFALAQFEARVNAKLVAPGSYLVVENLDRLTREHWSESVPYVLSLIAKGIRIVQLSPTEAVYDSGMDQGRLMLMLMELGRAHSESKLKSERIKDAWNRRREAAAAGEPHGGRYPEWLQLRDGKYALRPDAARAVRLIFKLCIAGKGYVQIKRYLESNSVAPFFGPRWSRSYIAKILASRATIGEYQPCQGSHGQAVPIGEPIKGYYPAVVKDSVFFAARRAAAARAGRCGRPSKGRVPAHVFSGLLYSAADGAKLYTASTSRGTFLGSAAAFNGQEGSRWTGFRLDHFAAAILKELHELTSSALFDDPGSTLADELRAKIRDVAARLDAARQRWEADPESTFWQEQASKWDREQRTLAAELREAEQQAAHPTSATWSEAVELMMQNEPERLRQCLLETISAMWVLVVVREKGRRLAAVQVKFQGGSERNYLILSSTPIGQACRTEKAGWRSSSFEGKVPGGFDLSNRSEAAELARLLREVDINRI